VQNFIAGKSDFSPTGSHPKTVYKITNDPRVTWIGKFMRRTSLDEIPQFWNVLKGDMSLVGPRPPVQYEFDVYDIWHRRRSLEVRPGITGLWQVYGRSKTTFDQMVRLDLQYSRSWSPLLDLKILLQTPRAMLSGDGAY
jgi:lipopolysaccharide/colanic/teichoic acid biosynthesis glycosyltransferase